MLFINNARATRVYYLILTHTRAERVGVLKCYTSQVPGFNVYNTRYDKKDMLQSTTFIVLDFGDA